MSPTSRPPRLEIVEHHVDPATTLMLTGELDLSGWSSEAATDGAARH
jgi:hypothetical protein